jgi:hypothetical protein
MKKAKKASKHTMPSPDEIKIIEVQEVGTSSCGCGM